MPLVELLQPPAADARMQGHEDAGPRAVHSCLPGALGGLYLALRVQLGRVLAQVPDRTGLVLRVPVAGPLLELPVQVEAVGHHGGVDALDVLLGLGDLPDVERALAGRAALI